MIHRRGDRQRLEGRPQLVAGLHHIVATRRIVAVLRRIGGELVGIEHRQRRHGDDLAGIGVQDDAARAARLLRHHLLIEFAFQRRLHPRVDRQHQRRVAHGRIGQPVVERHFHAHAAARIARREAQHVRGQRALRIDPLLLARELDADFAQRVHRRHLLGKRTLAQIGPAAPGQFLVEVGGAFVGKDFIELAGQFRRIADEFVRPHRNRIAVHRARQRHAVAIDDIGARQHARRHAAARAIARKHAHPRQAHRDQARHRDEQQKQQHQTLMCHRRQRDAIRAGTRPIRADDQCGH